MSSLELEFLERIEKHKGVLFKISKMYMDEPEDQSDLFQENYLSAVESLPEFWGKKQIFYLDVSCSPEYCDSFPKIWEEKRIHLSGRGNSEFWHQKWRNRRRRVQSKDNVWCHPPAKSDRQSTDILLFRRLFWEGNGGTTGNNGRKLPCKTKPSQTETERLSKRIDTQRIIKI